MTQYLQLLMDRASEGKEILIYGAGSQGRGLLHALRERGIEPVSFIDGNSALQGRSLAGLPVLPPTVLTEQKSTTPQQSEGYERGDDLPTLSRQAARNVLTRDSAERHFIIIAAFFFEREISTFLEKCGFLRNINYVAYSDLKPRDYAVEVSGICNLHCISCPRGEERSSKRSTKMMSLDTFKKVITKIRQEDPFVGNIQLYQWGEPTLNKDLPAMIRYARERGILCTISSNLNYGADFEALIDSHPECLRLSVSGTGDNYAITHTGGNWDLFVSNVERIANLRREIYPEMKVELYSHLYKQSLGAQQELIADLCRRFDFEYHPVPAYLISLDDVMKYCEGRPLPDSAQRARELLLVDIDEGLTMAKAEASLDCDALRVVLINADLSVSTCMMFFDPEENSCADNFLNVTIEKIDGRRKKASLCVKCRKHGIHRYCGIYAKISEEERQ